MHFTVTNKPKQFEFVPLATLCSSYCYHSRFFWWAGIGKSKMFSFYRLVGSRFFQEVITVMDPNEDRLINRYRSKRCPPLIGLSKGK